LTTGIQQMARWLQCTVRGALVSSKPCLEEDELFGSIATAAKM
jgi:hypothetical protein